MSRFFHEMRLWVLLPVMWGLTSIHAVFLLMLNTIMAVETWAYVALMDGIGSLLPKASGKER